MFANRPPWSMLSAALIDYLDDYPDTDEGIAAWHRDMHVATVRWNSICEWARARGHTLGCYS